MKTTFKKNKVYTAKLGNGQRVISVFATDKSDARGIIDKTLSLNLSRMGYKDKWIRDGKIVVNEDY